MIEKEKICEIEEGKSGDLFVMIKDITEKETKTGIAFLTLNVTDGDKTVDAKLWNTSKQMFEPSCGDVIKVRLEVDSYKGQPNYTIRNYRKRNDDEPDRTKFLKGAPIAPEEMYQEVMGILSGFPSGATRIAYHIYSDKKEQLLHWSAARKVHHTGIGELLYHSYRMMKAGVALCDVYPEADVPMVIAGCLLHDIGKLEELEVDEIGKTTLAVDGSLFGHLYLGCRMVEDYGKKLGVDAETIRQLTHIVASHHGKFEWGAISVPSTVEALIVHNCDLLDAKIYVMEDAYKEIEVHQIQQDPAFALEKANVYRTK